MNIEDFKKVSKVTYVYVEGECRGVFHPSSYHGYSFEYKTNKLKYSGYVEVPFSYDEFMSFDYYQQKAICAANLSKAGLAINVSSCNAKAFFEHKSQQDSETQ